ncbi:MAG: hypothetical protein FWF71_03330 [Actinomycetia bacterium]|nr:hypothetical protein [Actinomycetes bacterium]
MRHQTPSLFPKQRPRTAAKASLAEIDPINPTTKTTKVSGSSTPGAKVQLWYGSKMVKGAYAKSNGKFTLAKLSLKKYLGKTLTLTATKPGYQKVSVKLKVKAYVKPTLKTYQNFLNHLYRGAGYNKASKLLFMIDTAVGLSKPVQFNDWPTRRYSLSNIKSRIKDYFGKSYSSKTIINYLSSGEVYAYKGGYVYFNGGSLWSFGHTYKVKKAQRLANGTIALTVDVTAFGGGGAGYIDDDGLFEYKYKNKKFYIKENGQSRYGYNFISNQALGTGTKVRA